MDRRLSGFFGLHPKALTRRVSLNSPASHGPALGSPTPRQFAVGYADGYLPFDLVVFFEPLDLDFEPPDDFLAVVAFFAMALLPPFLSENVRNAKI